MLQLNNWLVTYNNISSLWTAQPSFLHVQVLIIIGGFITFYHALQNGNRFIHLWIGIILHGFVIEFVSYNLSDIDNFWHAQTPIIFIGQRLPLHIIFVYVVFIYPAVIAIDSLKLPLFVEPFGIGLVTVLIDYPYDIIGIRYMHWTWHATDPNIIDRHYFVPWNSFYFHASFTASFIYFFHLSRFLILKKKEKWHVRESCLKELACTVIASTLGMPGGVIIFIILYHPLHDYYGLHSANIFILLCSIYFSIICLNFPTSSDKRTKTKKFNIIVCIYVVVYYMTFTCIVIFFDPAAEISTGWHQPVGPCDEIVSLRTALGQILLKNKYLCAANNAETYFGWSCLPNKEPPKDYTNWYTICGTPFTNKAEYIIILTATAIFGCSFFIKALYLNDNMFQSKNQDINFYAKKQQYYRHGLKYKNK